MADILLRLSMPAAFLDSDLTLYVVHGRGKQDLRGPNSTQPNLFHHGQTTYCTGLDDCLRMTQACFRKRMSARWMSACDGTPYLFQFVREAAEKCSSLK